MATWRRIGAADRLGGRAGIATPVEPGGDADDSLAERLAESIGDWALEAGLVVAVAESLTGGALGQTLAKAPEASEWFAGGVIAYRNETKHRALGVPEGPVVTAECACAMALGVRQLTGADAAVSVTGVGGPGEEEGKPAGTVFIGCSTEDGEQAFEYRFGGEPSDIVAQTIENALRRLAEALSGA